MTWSDLLTWCDDSAEFDDLDWKRDTQLIGESTPQKHCEARRLYLTHDELSYDAMI